MEDEINDSLTNRFDYYCKLWNVAETSFTVTREVRGRGRSRKTLTPIDSDESRVHFLEAELPVS